MWLAFVAVAVVAVAVAAAAVAAAVAVAVAVAAAVVVVVVVAAVVEVVVVVVSTQHALIAHFVLAVLVPPFVPPPVSFQVPGASFHQLLIVGASCWLPVRRSPSFLFQHRHV